MKLARYVFHESRMTPIDFMVKGQGHRTMMTLNGFQIILQSVLHLFVMKLVRSVSHESRFISLLTFKSKEERSRPWNSDNQK